MIVTEAQIRILLGLESSITDEEAATINLLHPQAEWAVRSFLGYDPEQAVRTEYYPRHQVTPGRVQGEALDVNSGHTRAIVSTISPTVGETLQLEHIPVRSITTIHRDSSARFGQQAGDFDSADLLVEGDDYWLELDEDNYSRSGMLYSTGSWPLTPGTVKVVYRAGFSPNELAGRAVANDTDADGNITTKGVNASGISRAVLLTVVSAFHDYVAFKKSSVTGFTPGPFQSERLQDYSYTLGGAQSSAATAIGSMTVQLPPAAQEAAEEFQHYGLMRL